MAIEDELTETTISLPSNLFQRAEDLAQGWGISRNELYWRALNHILARASESAATKELSEAYDKIYSSPEPENW